MDEPFDPIDGELPYADDELNAPWQSTDSVEDCWAEWYGEAIETHESPRSQVSYSCCSSPRKASNRSSAKSKRRNYFVLSRPSIDNSSTRDTYSNVGGEIPIVVDDFSVTEDYSNSQHPSFTERDHQQSSHRYYIPEDPSFNRFSLSTTEFLDTAVREERAATFSSKRHRRHETNSERKTEPHQSRRRHTPSSFSKMFGRGRRKHSPPPPNTHHAEHSTTDAANLHAAQEQLRRDQEALEAERNYLQQERLELKNDRQALDAERRALHEQQASAGAEIHFDIDDDVENMPGRVPFISPAGKFQRPEQPRGNTTWLREFESLITEQVSSLLSGPAYSASPIPTHISGTTISQTASRSCPAFLEQEEPSSPSPPRATPFQPTPKPITNSPNALNSLDLTKPPPLRQDHRPHNRERHLIVIMPVGTPCLRRMLTSLTQPSPVNATRS